ncbi:MAG: hypothetical protein PHX21_00150 [bacterium]|nr:hypothetical protein [bacterium]
MIITFLLLASLEANNVVDSVLYHIKAKQPDSCSMRASCSLDPEAKIEVKFSKNNGVDVKSESFVGEITKGALLLTGLGVYNFWKTIETNNIALEEGQQPGYCYLTLISKDSSLFTDATLKVKKSTWKIEEAKITTLADKITAKFIYNDRGMPITIDTDTQASKILIKNSYKQISPKIYIPLKTTFISTTSDTPEILVEYSILKI